ncbi:MFS superfamily sulfate permease-like transporter [Paenibacillus sp. PvP094]
MMRKMASQSLLVLGAIFIITAALPLFFNYPYRDGPQSGPSNVWELVQMFAHDSWASLLIMGLLLSIASRFVFRP